MPKRTEGYLPQDIEAEQSVLGSMLIDARAIEQIPFLKPSDFFLPANGAIYQAMLSLAAKNQPTDVVLVASALQAEGSLSVLGGVAYLASVSAMVPTSMNIEHYARIVSSLSTLRRLIDAGLEISRIGYDATQSPEEALAKSESILIHVVEESPLDDETKVMLLQRIYDRLTSPVDPKSTGISTGFRRSIDLLTRGGLSRGDLVILAARPSLGKTSLAVGIAHHAAVHSGRHVLFFSLEMSREAIFEKLLSVGTQMAWDTLHSHELMPSQSNLLAEHTEVLNRAPIDVVKASGWTVERLMSETWRRHRALPVDLVIVDYLQLARLQERRENRNQEVTQISRMLKELAQAIDAPVLALSQLNRGSEIRSSGQPTLADLRESGAIEQDADVVMFLYLDKDDEGNVHKESPVYPVVLDVQKNRLGPTGARLLAFNAALMAFSDSVGTNEVPEQHREVKSAFNF